MVPLAVAGRSYSLQSIVVFLVIVAIGYLLIRRRADHARGRGSEGTRPSGTAPPPGVEANRSERPPSPPPPAGDRPPDQQPGEATGTGPADNDAGPSRRSGEPAGHADQPGARSSTPQGAPQSATRSRKGSGRKRLGAEYTGPRPGPGFTSSRATRG